MEILQEAIKHWKDSGNETNIIHLGRTKTFMFFLFSKMHLKNPKILVRVRLVTENRKWSNTDILSIKNAYQIGNYIMVSFNMFTNCDNL